MVDFWTRLLGQDGKSNPETKIDSEVTSKSPAERVSATATVEPRITPEPAVTLTYDKDGLKVASKIELEEPPKVDLETAVSGNPAEIVDSTSSPQQVDLPLGQAQDLPQVVSYDNSHQAHQVMGINTAGSNSSEEKDTDLRYKLVDDLSGWMDFLWEFRIKESTSDVILAVDTESVGLAPYESGETKLLGISLSFTEGYAIYVPWKALHENPEMYESVKKLLENTNVSGHHLKHDYKWLIAYGIYPKKIVFDTMMAHYWIYNNSLDNKLKSMTARYIPELGGYEADVSRIFESNGHRMDKVPMDLLVPYACSDADATLRLTDILRRKIFLDGSMDGFMRLCIEPILVFARIEMNGVRADLDECKALRECYEEGLKKDEEKLREFWFIQDYCKLNNMNPSKFSFTARRPLQCVLYMMLDLPLDPDFKNEPILFNSGSEFIKENMDSLVQNSLDMIRSLSEGKCPNLQKIWKDLEKERKSGNRAWDRLNPEDRKNILESLARESNWAKGALRYETFYLIRDWILRKMKLHFPIPLGVNADYLDERINELESQGVDVSRLRVYKDVIEFLTILITYKANIKIYTTYVLKFPEWVCPDGLIHTNYLQHGTVSGRYSSAKPSIHTLPWKSSVKDMMISRWRECGGLLLKIDGSQMEIRVMAALARPGKLRELLEDPNADIHRYTASRIFNKPMDKVTEAERRNAKAATFATLYGGGPGSIAGSHSMSRAVSIMAQESEYIDLDSLHMDYDEAKMFMDEVYGTYPEIKKYLREKIEIARKNGYVLSPSGRKRLIPEINSSDKSKRLKAERQAINSPIQGAASDLMMRCITRLEPILTANYCSLIFGFVHDDISIDVYPGELPAIMKLVEHQVSYETAKESPWALPVVFEFEMGTTLGHMFGIKSYNLMDDRSAVFEIAFDDKAQGYLGKLLESLSCAYDLKCEGEHNESKRKYIYKMSLTSKNFIYPTAEFVKAREEVTG